MNGNTQPLRATRLALLWPPTAAIAIYLLCRPLLDEPQAQLIAVVALLVVWWTNEALPLGVVSLLPLLLFPAFAVAPMSAVAVHFANPMIFLFLGGFMLAIAVEKSSLHQQIAFRLMQLFPATVKGTLFALTLTSALLSGLMWLSAGQECPQAEYTGIALEYGTVPIPAVIEALRADQWAENHPEIDPALRQAIRRQVRDAFYTDTPAWKTRIVAQGLEAARQAVTGLAAPPP